MEISKLLNLIDEISIKDGEPAIKKKFDLIKVALDHLRTTKNNDDFIEVFKRVHWFGYEIGHSKATEIFALDFHKPLVAESLKLVRSLSFIDKRMILTYKDALLYEYDPKKRKQLEDEIQKLDG